MKLVIRNLSKRYPDGTQALSDVSLEIPSGMFGLLGPNGAGKSTLMRTLATMQDADSGSVFLDTLDVLNNKADVRKILGYLPQDFGLYPQVTAWRMLIHFAALRGIWPASERRNLCSALLERVNLFHVKNKKLGSFSGGMRQRFGIALALLGSPQLIIVDEPTAGLDPEERDRFLNLLSEISSDAVVILSTHYVADVSELCPRMAVINRGRVILTGEPSMLVQKQAGQLWKKTVERSGIEGLEQRYQVISKRMFAGKFVVHVHSEDKPGENFEPASPNLHDIYLISVKKDDRDQGAKE